MLACSCWLSRIADSIWIFCLSGWTPVHPRCDIPHLLRELPDMHDEKNPKHLLPLSSRCIGFTWSKCDLGSSLILTIKEKRERLDFEYSGCWKGSRRVQDRCDIPNRWSHLYKSTVSFSIKSVLPNGKFAVCSQMKDIKVRIESGCNRGERWQQKDTYFSYPFETLLWNWRWIFVLLSPKIFKREWRRKSECWYYPLKSDICQMGYPRSILSP